MPAGCLFRGFVCLITSQSWTQSQAVPISVPSLQPPVAVLTSSPGRGVVSKATPCIADGPEPIRIRGAGRETFECGSPRTVTLAAPRLKEEMQWLNPLGEEVDGH